MATKPFRSGVNDEQPAGAMGRETLCHHGAMQKLAEMPGMGHIRADITDPRYRFWSVYSYLIVYRPDTDPLQVIRVVSGHRDLSRLFS